ncbi:protocadherin Fat 4-like [Saccostrea cucullata]|uniref:protocadherin Fat 4-like n=1 Tax=Saccostrea cuccullata TaxID=36930 RepID=UPI002ED0A702
MYENFNFPATTPNPCVEYRVGRNLSEGCGNHSDSGYCVDDNSACLPSPEGTDWKCICINGFFSFNSSCVPVPESLFDDKNISLGIFTTDRVVSISKSSTKDSEHYFNFGDDVQALDTNNGDCTLKTLESGFGCFLNNTGIIVKIEKFLEDKLYHVIAHVTVFIGPEKAKVEDTLGISFDIQTIRENQTIILADGIMKDTLVTKVDLVSYETSPFLFGDVSYFHMDSNGIVKTNWTISLDDHDPKLISKLFITYAYTDLFIGIVVYKKEYKMDINENTNETVICITAPNVDSTILQPHDFVALQSNGSVVVQKPFDYETIKEYKFSVFSQYNGQNFTTDVTLNIVDQNDVMPSFTSTTYNFKAIQSDFSTVVGVVSASDPDTVGSLEYNITGDSRFSISPSGVISLTNAQRNGNATITVSDGKLHNQASVNVEVIPVVTNDTHSQFNFTCEVLENQSTGTFVCNISISGYTDYIFDLPDAQNFFNLNAENGQISTNAKIDRETKPSYNYSVFAKEEKRSCKFASIQVQILVKDENDNPPLFERATYVGTIKEHSANGTIIQLDHPISATDRDVNSVFTYNISGDAFDIDASTGEISSLKVLDREGKEYYDLILGVFDGVHATTSSVRISVADINDNPPILPSTTFSIPENASVDSNIGQLHATDNDKNINAELFYRCASEYFKINSTGMLKVGRELDRETINHHVFNCAVCDNGKPSPLCATSEIQVNISDINEEPRKKNDGKVFSVPETSNCLSVWNMASFFEDDDLGSNSELEFRILSKSTNNTIYVLVEDVNDNTPIPSEDKDFEIIFYSGECKSGGCSKLVALITASDADTGINAELLFQEFGGSAASFLEVERDTGLVSAISQPSGNGVYQYTVIISDKGTPPLNATTTISLNVTILKDTGSDIIPIFPTDKLVFNWTENVEFSAPFIYLKNFTTDETPSSVTFHTPNYIHADFYLDDNNTELFVNTTALQIKQGNSSFFDREKRALFRFIVQAKLSQYSMLAELIINILDVNDNPPEFISKTPRVVLIREDAINGTGLDVSLEATDIDEGENAVIAYRISQEECGGVFQLRNTKDIYLNGELDYETIPVCSLTIKVYNPNKEEMNSVTKVSIEIEDVNDNAPIFNASIYHIALNETRTEDLNKKKTITVPQFSVVDEDSRQYGTKGLRLSIEEPSMCPVLVEKDRADDFTLTVNPGMELDYEKKKNYNCTLIARDGGGKSSTALLVIELLDVNDNAPESDDVIQIEILRSINISHVIVDFINATDKDSGNNALIEFAFADTSGAYSFFAINSSSGEISIAKNLSKLQVDSAELYVIVSDKGNPPLSTNVTVKITIIDENRRPFFNQSVYQVEVEENTILTGLLTTVTAEDWEKNETKICNCTYSFQHDDDSSFYTIKQRSGEIYVTSQNLRYDREVRPVVSLTVVAEDEGGKQTRAEVRIKVLDQNDNDPKFVEDYYQFEIYQEAFEGTYIGKVLAVDKDEGDNALTMYRITNESSIGSNYNDSVIVINETTGELFSNGSLNIGSVKDFEEIVTVEAFDKNDSLRTDRVRVSVTIKYNDTNQNPPVFNLSDDARSKPINIPLTTMTEGSHIFQLTAIDVDSGKDGQVVYSILDGNAFNMFHINSTGAISLRKKVTFVGDQTINLTVQAKDQGVNAKSGIVSLPLTLRGEPECGLSTTGASAAEKQFQTYTWSLLGVTCLLILTTGIAICGWCRSRLNAKKASDIHDDSSEQARMFGLKLNPSYGAGLPQLGKFLDSTNDNQRRRYNYRIGSVGFESSTDEPEEFDRRRSFRPSMFDPTPSQAPPPLPKPRNSGAPFIPKPDYE